MDASSKLELIAVPGLPEIEPGADLADLLLAATREAETAIESGDVLLLAHKVVSKAEGRFVDLNAIHPSPRARDLARITGKDPRKVEVIIKESRAMLRVRPSEGAREGLLICEHRLGFICANAGVDASNVPGEERVLLLPENPDGSAGRIRERIESATGQRIGVVITDTFGRPWRNGLVNTAIGLAGLPAFRDWRGESDASGRPLRVTVHALADELAAAAGLLSGKLERQPAVIARGLPWTESTDTVSTLLRPADQDLFR